MALTRKFLKSMGLTDEQVESIVEAHTETVDGLKEQISTLKETADKLPAVQKELDGIKAGKDWKAEHDKVKAELDKFRAEVADKEALATKEGAFRKLLTAENIPEKYHDRICKVTDFASMEMDGDSIKDPDKARESIRTEWGDFVATTERRPAEVATPPSTGKAKLTREDIYKRDEKGRYIMTTAERQKALADNPELLKG